MSKKYLSWVRSWPCVGCGSHLTEAHHMRELALGAGMGKKVGDIFTIPVCRGCHQRCHSLEYTKEDQLTWLYKTQNRAILAQLIKW